MKMNRVKKTNMIMLIGFTVIVPSIGLLYWILFYLYISTAIFWLSITVVCSAVAFGEIKRGVKPGVAFLFLGSVGAVIAVNTVNREYSGKEKVYICFSVFIWLFVVYPLAPFCIEWCSAALDWSLNN